MCVCRLLEILPCMVSGVCHWVQLEGGGLHSGFSLQCQRVHCWILASPCRVYCYHWYLRGHTWMLSLKPIVTKYVGKRTWHFSDPRWHPWHVYFQLVWVSFECVFEGTHASTRLPYMQSDSMARQRISGYSHQRQSDYLTCGASRMVECFVVH